MSRTLQQSLLASGRIKPEEREIMPSMIATMMAPLVHALRPDQFDMNKSQTLFMTFLWYCRNILYLLPHFLLLLVEEINYWDRRKVETSFAKNKNI